MGNSNKPCYKSTSDTLCACFKHLNIAFQELKHHQYMVITYPGDEEGTLIFNSPRSAVRARFRGITPYEANMFYLECLSKDNSFIINKFQCAPNTAFELIYKRK